MFKCGIYAASMGENAFGVGKQYLQFVKDLGGVPRILTPDNVYEENIDILLLQGGLDINPTSYGEHPHYYTGNTDVFKQHVYDNCLPNYISEGKKVFGICLGFQQIASYFETRITQHLPYHPQSDARAKKAHEVWVENRDVVHVTANTDPKMLKYDVNSFHHQGILREDLNEELISLAYAKNEFNAEDANIHIIEAFIHRELPVGGVQWHPEDFGTWHVWNLFHYILNM